jgi:hypothetical protein
MKPRCWFCGRPVVPGERVNHSLDGGLAVHVDCLRRDALTDGDAADRADRSG